MKTNQLRQVFFTQQLYATWTPDSLVATCRLPSIISCVYNAENKTIFGGGGLVVNSSGLTVRVRVDGVDKLGVRGVQPVRGVSSFKHGPSRVQACVIEGWNSLNYQYQKNVRNVPAELTLRVNLLLVFV